MNWTIILVVGVPCVVLLYAIVYRIVKDMFKK